MTKHTGHNHPATPAARAACRKLVTTVVNLAKGDMVKVNGDWAVLLNTPLHNRPDAEIRVGFRGDVKAWVLAANVDEIDRRPRS